jgi:ABC-type polysaccharide/polyol phosphate transport system ATPase subunit
MTPQVVCEDLWKSYHRHRPMGIKALLVGSAQPSETRFAREWALSGVSFGVARGQAFGVIGHNGSGKTTLLSVLLGTVPADRGAARCAGRVASLLELGAGFHGDLTGEENVFLHGAILGMSLAEIRRSLPAIVEFSELGEAVASPLRTYSAGMMARLGFAVIAHCAADVLLIDEVLAVGDARFQAKCRDYLRAFKQRNGTLLIVSHSLKDLEGICDDGVCLELGRIVDSGPIAEVTGRYRARMAAPRAA